MHEAGGRSLMLKRASVILLVVVLLLQLAGGTQAIHALESHNHDGGYATQVEHGPAIDHEHSEPSVPGERPPIGPHDADDCTICLTLLHSTATPLDLARAGVVLSDVGRVVFVSLDGRVVGRSIHLPTGRGPPLVHI